MFFFTEKVNNPTIWMISPVPEAMAAAPFQLPVQASRDGMLKQNGLVTVVEPDIAPEDKLQELRNFLGGEPSRQQKRTLPGPYNC